MIQNEFTDTEVEHERIRDRAGTARISMRLQERIRDLEQTLREERRALAEAEQHYEKLEEKYNALLNQNAPAS